MRCLAIVLFWSSLVMVSSAILFDAKGRASSQLPECPLGEYRSPNLIGPSCLPCSTCPPNHIIRKLCTPDSDTECTLYKFDLINPDLSPDQHKQEMDAMLSEYWQEVLKEQEGNQNHVSTGYAMNRNSAPEERVPSDNTKSHSGAMCELCYGAIGALIVLCLALALFIVYLHWKHSATPIQKVITIPGNDDPTIYYHADQIVVPTSDGSGTTTYTVVPQIPRGTTITVPRELVHLEAQVQRNSQRRTMFGQYLNNGRSSSTSGNEYIEESYRVRLSSSDNDSIEPLVAESDPVTHADV